MPTKGVHTMPKATSTYPPEFKREAVRLVRSSSSTSITQIARDIAVSYDSLRNWVKQAEVDQGDLWVSDKGMAPRVVAHPGTRPTEKGEHCGHYQNTATPPRRPRPPARWPTRLHRWLDNARLARGRPRDCRGGGGALA